MLNHLDSPTSLHCLREVIDDFDGFVVDQFGVLHDGEKPYPDAVNALRLLMDAGKRVVILSNSGKRSDINIARMSKLGFGRSLFSEFVTSGDVAFAKVKAEYIDKGMQHCLLIARDNDISAVEGLDLKLTSNVDLCDFIIISASEGDRYSEAHYSDLLQKVAVRKVPCLCTNPDKLMLTSAGIRFGAGRIAELYEQMGGVVQWIGKPYPDVYKHALRYMRDTSPPRILCIGDSIEHDIAGGANAGLKTLFIRDGIHRDMDNNQVTRYMKEHKAVPDFQMQALS